MDVRSRLGLLGVLLTTVGCQFVPRSDLRASQSRERALAEQNRAQLSEIANLQQHARELENRLLEHEAVARQQTDEKFY